MTSPFDEPGFREQMARMGVVHKPGMAADMLKQLAPLLAAEGLDMDDPDTLPDLETVNAALDRATAQHNFMLSTPIGTPRDRALGVLREVTLALGDEDADRAASILGRIESEPNGDEPSVAHVIGVALGLLDTWHSDPAASPHLTRARVPRWPNGRSRKAATDIVALSKKGRAFDSQGGLIGRHLGLQVFEGAALAVAGSVLAWAASEGVKTEALLSRVVSESGHQPPAPAGASFRRPSAQPARLDVQRGFEAWLKDAAPDISAPTVAEEAQMFTALLRMAGALLLDLGDADDALVFFDEILEEDDDFPLEPALLTLYDYAQFQSETAQAPEGWEALREEIDGELDGEPPIVEAVQIAIEEDSEVPDADKRSILEETLLVAAVAPLLEWMGKGRPVTSTGNVRRADIAVVSALLGITAEGVAKSPEISDDDFERMMAGGERMSFQVTSMSDVPMVREWWEALRLCDVIAITASRVKPGPAAAIWADGSVPLADLQMLVGVFISELIVGPNALDRFGIARAASIMRELHDLIAPDMPGDAEHHDLLRALSSQTMARLPRLGIGEVDAEGSVSLPRAVRGTVARGMLLAMSLLREGLE